MSKFIRPARNAVKYNSAPTRNVSLDFFQGAAQGVELLGGLKQLPIDQADDLEAKFNSGCNRTDMPSAWGHPNVDRKLGRNRFLLANEIKGWRRNKGEPL